MLIEVPNALILSYVIVAGMNAGAVPSFARMPASEVGFAPGRTVHGLGSGAAAADFDDDGDVDIFVPTRVDYGHLLYINRGDGRFDEASEAAGLDGAGFQGRAALWFDANGDGKLDLVVGTDCFRVTSCDEARPGLRLYLQGENGTFEDTTEISGLGASIADTSVHRSGLASGDLNGDGRLDLVTGFWVGEIELFMNQGDGSFANRTEAAGIHLDDHGHWQPVILDFNGDGRQDIYWSVDFGPNELWVNTGNQDGVPQFTDAAPAANCDNDMNDMGIAIGDLDFDGDPDLYVTNIFRDGKHNVLLMNTTEMGSAGCSETSMVSGVDDGGWGWGAVFADFDQDGWLDLAETNGWRFGSWDQPNRLFLNQRGETPWFMEVAQNAGMGDTTTWGSALIAADVDRDGDQDLLQTLADPIASPTITPEPLYLYRNELVNDGSANYLTIVPRQGGPNRYAVGARITVAAAGREYHSWTTAGSSFLGQAPSEAHFGLGDATVAEWIEVRWPGAGATRISAVTANQTLVVHRTTILRDGFESAR